MLHAQGQAGSGTGRRLIAVLAIAVFLGASATASAEPWWCSPFETELGAPVSHEQIADVVDNNVGSPGTAAGGLPEDLNPMLYIAHGQAIADIPAGIDPANAASGFAISLPDDRRTGINTNMRSNTGDLGSALTFEGYFYMPSDEFITAPTFIGRRLVTQKRSDNDGESRMAIGPQAETRTVGAVEGLFDYEGFNYAGTSLVGQSGGTGWSGPWVDPTTGGFTTDNLSSDNVSLDSDAFPFTPVGKRFSATGGHISRPLSRPVNLGEEGQVTYLSALLAKTETTEGGSRNLEIGLATGPNVAATGSTIRIGSTSGHQFFLRVATNATGTVVAGDAYFIILKVVAHVGAPNQTYMSIYGPEDTVPTEEPTTWDLTNEFTSDLMLTHLKLTVGSAQIKGEVDEIRLGSSYEGVTDPEAPLGDPGVTTTRNYLSAVWVETDGGDPAVLTTHLETGTTPLEANTWYHFALVHDGEELRWYLDGDLEGAVSTPGLTPPGTAKIAIGNNRSFGSADRGFYGALDEIRLWDRALAPNELLVNSGGPGEGLLWRSSFETNKDQAVTHGQPAQEPNCIDNAVGPPNGTPAGVTASGYVAYSQASVPVVPGDIDPVGLAGSFAMSLPELPNVGINTGIPSNSGNLANAMTAQGYFNSRQPVPAGGTAVGSRLVSTMRSAGQNQVRLAIGLVPNPSPPPGGPPNVLAVAYHNGTEVLVAIDPTPTPIQTNTWYHFAMVYDGSDIRWYLDGDLEGEVLGPTLTAPGSANMSIGNDTSTGVGQRGFFGLLDKVVISDHVIAPAEFMTEGFDPCLGLWCNVPFADWDDDGDVDHVDFGILQSCLGGDASGACACFDRDEDEAIGIADFEEFEACWTGPAVPWSPLLTPGCNP